MVMNSHAILPQAIPAYTVRLLNSLSSVNNSAEGRLEIYYNGIWGTVCDDGFTNASARVACASLGYGYIGEFIGNRHGGGTGRIWLEDVTCTGVEYGIEKCPHRTWSSHDCSHGEDVSIKCGTSGAYAIRLINSLSSVSNPNEGRLEIFYSGVWGTVCNDNFTSTNAKVACSSLGYGYVGAVITNRHGSGTGSIWLDEVTCSGAEQSIDRCLHRDWGSHDCTHPEDVAISCGATPRLVNSLSSVTNPNEGRLEIYYAGEWGTVCDDKFTNISARVACQSLGFGYVGTVITNRHGSGNGSIWLDEVTCGGTEQSIDKCSHGSWGSHDCSHSEDIAISCGAAPRLVNVQSSVTNPQEGRLEIYYGGEWGTVCDDSFTNISAGVACDSLGLGKIGTFIATRNGNATGRIWLDDIRCTGTELGVDRCAHNAWGINDCSHNEDVSIRCGDTLDYAVRLVNTLTDVSKVMEGRLEIYYSGIWGTVCDDSFTNASAQVACASLGFGYIGRFIGNRHTNGTGQIWLDEVNCLGNESGIEICQHSSWGIHNCGHNEDVSIACGNTPDYSVRLINAIAGDVNPMEGQLEIYYAGVWGAVCYDGFTDINAGIACASLGFGNNGKFIGNRYGTGRGQIWLDDVICNGTERSIDQCSHRAWGSHNCHSGKHVSIKCGDTEEYSVRLINSRNPVANPMEGRLEIYFAGVWGSVCDDGFTNINAKVVCVSLGYGYVGTYIGRSYYGPGTGKIWMDDVSCTGREPSIDKCSFRPWGLHSCNNSEDVGVKCGSAQNFSLRLVNLVSHIRNPKEGRLEIYYSGSWVTVCNDNFTNFSAEVACASLGFGRIGTVIDRRHGPGTGRILLDEVVCVGTEQGINECSHSPWGTHDCTHDQDVSISCGEYFIELGQHRGLLTMLSAHPCTLSDVLSMPVYLSTHLADRSARPIHHDTVGPYRAYYP